MSTSAGETRPWLWPALTALASLAAGPQAAWPSRTYFFRDFAITFEPLRELFLRALQSGRWIAWNPYSYEGAALLPTLYPPDLLQLLWVGPVTASWLLTLHFPLAALAMYLLARELGASRPGACAAGLVYALGGLAQSSLNLTVFLEALALAPLLAAALRRAALQGGRFVSLAALALALSISTLAVEFVGQALLLGYLLALVEAPSRRALARLAAATALGVAVAGLPILLTLGIVSESLRHAGGDIGALQRSLHPFSLLQALTPNLFLSLHEPLRWGWSSRLFPEGGPYFLSFYLGPTALAAAACGVRRPGMLRAGLVALALLGLWYALGRHAGLAPLLAPAVPFFRFPVKALLLPSLCVALFAGFGVTGLGEGRGFRTVAALAGAAAVAAGLGTWWAYAHAEALGAWLRVRPETLPVHLGLLREDAVHAALMALVLAAAAVAVRLGRLSPGAGSLVTVVLLGADLARAAAGLNPQTSPLFYRPLPELPPLVTQLDGGRVLSLGCFLSPRFDAYLRSGSPGVDLGSFFLYRQTLSPYTNVLDGVELAGGQDLNSFIPTGPLVRLGAYRPEAIGGVTRALRNAAVTRVVSLDPIEHAEFLPRATIATGLPELSLHVYALADPWPRAYVACRADVEPDAARALERALAPAFDPRRDAVLPVAVPAACGESRVERGSAAPGDDSYTVTSDGPGVLVLRDSFTPSWRATVDGVEAPVLRANGRHRGVPVGPGRHQVRVFYAPPLLRPGLALSALGLLMAGALLRRRDGLAGSMV